jgi:O-antigen/teichoic acid export membrane protein
VSTAEEPVPDVLDTPDAGPAVIRGGALRAGGYMAGILLALASAPFLVRHLGNVDFGRYTVVLSIIALVAGLTEGGVQAVGLREYTVRSGADRHRLLRHLLGVRIAFTLVAVVLAVGFAAVAGYGKTMVLGTALAGIGLLLQSTQNLVAVPLQGELRFGWATATDLCRQTVTVALTLALIVTGASLLPFFATSIVGGVVALVMTVVLVRHAMPMRPAFDRADWWLLIRDTFPYAAAIALNVAYFRIGVIIVSLVSTAIETGYYSVSYRILEVILPIPALMIGAVFPVLARAARDDHERLSYATKRVFETAVIVGALFVIGIELGAPFLVKVLAGHAPHSVPILRIQGVAILATFVAVACGFPLLSLHKHRELLLANLVALTLCVSLTFTLVPGLGGKGAAIGAAAAEYALAGVTAFLLARSSRALRLPLGAAAIVIAVAALAIGVAFIPPIPSVARVALGSLIYIALLAVLGRIPAELLEHIPGLRMRTQ